MPPQVIRGDDETFGQRAWRKSLEEPWIPAGCFLTLASFTMATYRLRQGNSKSFNVWLRYRVAAQTLTVIAIAYGGYKVGRFGFQTPEQRAEEAEKKKQLAEDLRDKGKAGFQARMAGAEAAHSLEVSQQRATPTTSAASNRSTWWPSSWLSGSSSSPSPEDKDKPK